MRLREEYSIYAIETGRICVAALNSEERRLRRRRDRESHRNRPVKLRP